MEKQDHKLNKSIAIINAIKEAADTITRHAKDLPKDKFHKNVFIKSYNRRPRNQQKRARAINGMAIAKAKGISQIRIITTQPLPKFKGGGVTGLIDNHEKEEIIMRRNCNG